MAGQGWRMLVEQLSVGRCISLPSNATGGAKAGVFASGAYTRIRRQFNMSVGKFEGVEAVIARMVGNTYTMDAARSVTAGAIDGGEKPSVPSAMLKYHVTEMGRQVANDAMDVHGGKGIQLGPRNYLGRSYQVVPVAITVEGANILTRSLIIFGQGAIRCHPFVLKEMNAARNPDRKQGVDEFDSALFGHIGFTISNAVRSFVMALTHARFTHVPEVGDTKRYYQHIVRFSASFAFAVDVAMLTLGGYLKKKENLSARLGDVLSAMYLASMVLKHHENQGRPADDLPIVEWACRNQLYKAQEQLHDFLRNFPNRFLGWAMRALIFPGGRAYSAPSDRLGRKLADAVLSAERSARSPVPLRLSHARARQSSRPAAGSAGPVADRRAHRKAHPRRRREDRQGHGARSRRADHPGTRRRASFPRPRPRCCATTIARSWSSSASTTSNRTSSQRRRSPRTRRRASDFHVPPARSHEPETMSSPPVPVVESARASAAADAGLRELRQRRWTANIARPAGSVMSRTCIPSPTSPPKRSKAFRTPIRVCGKRSGTSSAVPDFSRASFSPADACATCRRSACISSSAWCSSWPWVRRKAR